MLEQQCAEPGVALVQWRHGRGARLDGRRLVTACENRPVVRPRLLVPSILAVVLVAGCGSGGDTTYSVEKSRACLEKAGYRTAAPPASDVVASAAEGGAFSIRFPGGRNIVIVSFGLDRNGAERIVRGYQRFRGSNIGLTDVLSARHNAVLLWAAHPADSDRKAVEGCLR
jgi:hypothetical protein